MGLLRVLGIGFLALVILALALFIANFASYYNQVTRPVGVRLVNDWPVGIAYAGPRTTAIAGYYCIENVNSTNGFSIQLNAMLDNGLWVQNAYGTFINGGPWQTAFLDNVWTQSSTNGSAVFLHANNPLNTMTNAPCAWLIIALRNNMVYFGYSLDGRSIVWYDSYPANASYITTTLGYTNIVLAGPGNGVEAQLGSGTLVYLALYYWGNNSWVPAPVSTNANGPLDFVNHAYVFTDGSCGGVVSWPSPVNNTQCPGPPGFKP
jgi:hypothetical protein